MSYKHPPVQMRKQDNLGVNGVIQLGVFLKLWELMSHLECFLRLLFGYTDPAILSSLQDFWF